MGYAAGPAAIIQQMAKLQQYTFVCAPSMAQVACSGAFDTDMSDAVADYQRKRDLVEQTMSEVTNLVHAGGAFYAFVEVPPRLGITASSFAERAVERNVLIIPGQVFSRRDTHLRISYAAPDETLRAGLEVLCEMMHAP